MCKPLVMSKDMRKSLIREFFGALDAYQPSEGKFCYEKIIKSPKEKAKIIYTETAWYKQSMLVQNNSGEVAWHPLVKRGENENEYFVYDILVHPQTVTGVKVDTDPVEYANWLMSDEIDPYFDDIRCRAHSHVNMGVTPSGTDLSDWDEVLKDFNSEDRKSIFYIFMIWNKKGDKTIKIYDFRKNILFETDDVEIEIAEDSTGLKKFLEESSKLIKKRTYSTYSGNSSYYNNSYKGSNTSYGSSSYGSSGYGSSNYSSASNYGSSHSSTTKTEDKKPTDVSIIPKSSSSEIKTASQKNKKRKGRRKKKKGRGRNTNLNKIYDLQDAMYSDEELPIDSNYDNYYTD